MTSIRHFETTYAEIRQRLMTGYWQPGFQLVTPHLASDLDVSMSPVRDSLCNLAGRKMVDFIPTAGFFVPQINEPQFHDLMDLQRLLLHAATVGGEVSPWDGSSIQDHPVRTGALFEHIASWSGNTALIEAVRDLGDRLHVFRCLDQAILPNALEEMDALENTLSKASPIRVVRDLLSHYHAVRKRKAGYYLRRRAEGHSNLSGDAL